MEKNKINKRTLPVIGICGFSGSGKTTLVEKILMKLRNSSLKIAVVKHSSSQLDVDRSGKDSDRFFCAGADVFLEGRNELFSRGHKSKDNDLLHKVESLSVKYDLILVEGYKHSSIPKIWLYRDGENEVPQGASQILAALNFNEERLGKSLDIINDILKNHCSNDLLYGCVLAGGQSKRMGTPKHLIKHAGETWLDIIVNRLKVFTDHIVVSGGENAVDYRPSLPDIPGTYGPLGGILSAMRWHPMASFIFCPCDVPHISEEAIAWLLDQRKPGVWGILPKVEGRLQPLFAYYDFRVKLFWEELYGNGEFRLSEISHFDRVIIVEPPSNIKAAWQNCNFPHEIQ